MAEIRTAPLVVEFPFTRSLGPVQSAFLTGLRERTVLGVRAGDGRVIVPPAEYDPVTAEEIRDLVEVGSAGTVTTWAWNPAPRRGQPLATPFAWVLVRLDGADTALLHALDVPGPESVHTGLRVRIRWAAERTGAITDIACFTPYEGPPSGAEPAAHRGSSPTPSPASPPPPASTTPTHPAAPSPATSGRSPDTGPSANAAPPATRSMYRPAVPAPPAVSPPTPRSRSAPAAPSPPTASSTSRPGTSTSRSPTSTPTSPWTAPVWPCTRASAASPTTRSGWACASNRCGPPTAPSPTTTAPPANPTLPTTATRS